MHTNTFWVLSPGVARQSFTAAIMAWVEPPWDSSHLFLVPRIQQRSFGCVNKHVEFSGQFKETPWGRAHSPLVSFVLYPPPFVSSLKPNSDDGMDPTVDSALSPGAPAGHQANSAITSKPSTATNWMCLVRTLFRAPHITTFSPHKFS
jgi:hypothetical protein